MQWKRFLQLLVILGVSALVVACGGGGNAMQSTSTTPTVAQLSGAYAFSASGADPADGDYFVAGSFTADGKGGLSGIEDLNLGSGVDSSVPFTGTYQLDSSGNGHDGTLSGSSSFVPGEAGGALNLTGGSGDVPNASAFNFGTGDFTLAGWIWTLRKQDGAR